jgi:hypothetical protein
MCGQIVSNEMAGLGSSKATCMFVNLYGARCKGRQCVTKVADEVKDDEQ